MKRHYLADVIGDGTPDTNEWRPSVANYPVGWGWQCPVDANNTPLNAWGLVEVFHETPEAIAAMALDPTLDPLPHVARDVLLSGVDTAVVRAALIRRGIGEDVLDEADTFGDLLDNITARAASPL